MLLAQCIESNPGPPRGRGSTARGSSGSYDARGRGRGGRNGRPDIAHDYFEGLPNPGQSNSQGNRRLTRSTSTVREQPSISSWFTSQSIQPLSDSQEISQSDKSREMTARNRDTDLESDISDID